MRGLERAASMRSSVSISAGVRTISGLASNWARADMVIQKMRQLTTVMRASSFTSRSAVCNLASSARQPDFMTLWNISTFQRKAYQSSLSTAAARSSIGRLVMSSQSIGPRSEGRPPGHEGRRGFATRSAFACRQAAMSSPRPPRCKQAVSPSSPPIATWWRPDQGTVASWGKARWHDATGCRQPRPVNLASPTFECCQSIARPPRRFLPDNLSGLVYRTYRNGIHRIIGTAADEDFSSLNGIGPCSSVKTRGAANGQAIETNTHLVRKAAAINALVLLLGQSDLRGLSPRRRSREGRKLVDASIDRHRPAHCRTKVYDAHFGSLASVALDQISGRKLGVTCYWRCREGQPHRAACPHR